MMGVKSSLPDVREKRARVISGDPEKVRAQRAADKLTARERMEALFDENSFVETDVLNEAAGVVTGYGTISGRGAYAFCQDFTVNLGSVGAAHAKKITKIIDAAIKCGCPVVGMYDTAGARLTEGALALAAYAEIAAKLAEASGIVPSVALVMGHCGGIAAAVAETQDFVIMSKAGQLFVNGAIVAGVDKLDEIGGANAAMKSGACAISAETDIEAINKARALIELLPDNNLEDAINECADDLNRVIPELNELDEITSQAGIVESVLDAGSAIALSSEFAPEMLTYIGSVGGRTVGVIAAEARLTRAGCRKAARFARFLDSFSIPVLSFVSSDGMTADEKNQGELAFAGAQLMFAMNDATTPRVAIVTGSAIGMAYAALASRSAADVVYAWPGSVFSPLTVPASVQVLMADKLDGSKNPLADRKKLEDEYARDIADCVTAAKLGLADDVIEPAATRQMIAAAIGMLESKRVMKPAKKQGNLPL